MSQPTRVLIADDHEIVREGLRTLLGEERDVAVVGEARDGDEAVTLAVKLKPDVVLMDLVMPGTGGIEAIRRIREKLPTTQVLVLTSFAGDSQVGAALEAGAIGYLMKDVMKGDLLRAIGDVQRGRPALHPEAQRQLLKKVTPDSAAAALTTLTDREREVLLLVARGKSNKAIAAQLFLSEGTVKGYVSGVLGKLGVEDRTQAALFAVKHGLVPRSEL